MGGRSLTREVVARHVAEIVGTHRQTLHGFEWERTVVFGHAMEPVRLQSGGGIAGNSRVWWIVSRRDGDEIQWNVGPITTVPGLRRALTEWLAGPRPGDHFGYRLYARRQRAAVVWNYQKIRTRARRTGRITTPPTNEGSGTT